MKLKLIQDPENKKKSRRLGEIGEMLARQKLRENDFRNVENLNHRRMNFEFTDIVAERSGRKFAISVKTRCKFGRLGGLNPMYLLGNEWRKHSEQAAEHLHAIPAWIAIQVDGPLFSMYFGPLSLVAESKGIPMEPEALEFYECLAKGEHHHFDEGSFTPKYRKIAVGNMEDKNG